MGLDINSVRFLIGCKQAGTRFQDVLTLGRQDLNVYPKKMAQVLRSHQLSGDAFEAAGTETLHAEPFFRALGASKIASMDMSDFEGATYVHDLNQPIRAEWKEQFDVVFDGGLLEHVFNLPTALKNCMEMVRVGGHFITHTITNNWCGHGFYQFSPELFYSTLSPENGFEVEAMILHHVGPYNRWLEVSNPRKVRARVETVTFAPAQLLVRAKRTHAAPIFAQTPQQSDYTVRWEDPNQPGGQAAPFTSARPRMARLFPNAMRLFHVMKMGLVLVRSQTLWNRKNFRPVKKP